MAPLEVHDLFLGVMNGVSRRLLRLMNRQ